MDLQAGPGDFDRKEMTMKTEELTGKERDTLTALKARDGDGATATAWEKAARDLGVARATFFAARSRLMEMGLVNRSEVRFSPAVPPPPPLIAVEDVIERITTEGTRSRRAYEFYLEAPGDRRLHQLATVVLDEHGLATGNSPWSRTIDLDKWDEGLVAVERAVAVLAGEGATG